MFNPLEPQFMEARKADLLREAKLRHAVREAQHDPARMDRFLAMIGDLLVEGGTRLQKRAMSSRSTPTAHVHSELKAV